MNCTHKVCKLIGFKGNDKLPICLKELHGILFVGNSNGSMWNLRENYTMFSKHSLFIDVDLLDKYLKQGVSEEAVEELFNEEFENIVREKLI